MALRVDNIELDETNLEFNQAADFVKSTDKLIYLTGKAGTGKTTFLKYIRSVTDKNTVILAPTGVAAINAGGVTINSFFQLPFGPFVPNDKRLRTSKDLGDVDDTTIYSTFRYREEKRNIIEGLELLIIDEISMVRCDTLDVIDKLLRVFRRKPFIPFGGVQVILIGDTFQLPPIASERNNEWQILSQFYDSRFFFSSQIIKSFIAEKKYLHFELKKIYRQKEQEFIDLLNRIRVNKVLDSDLRLLDSKYDPTFSSNGAANYIILSTHNFQVDQTNNTKLDALKAELKIFEGELSGEFPKDSKGGYVLPTDLNLKLKEGAQVMFLKNDAGEYKRYFNGKIGKIQSLSDSSIVVEFTDGTKVPVEKATWNHIEYTWNKEKKKVEEKIKGSFTQYPLRLAWAITVHKSQGLTFEKVIADLGAAFEDGQIYVALSRCTSSNGLSLKSRIPRNAIRVSQNVIEFAQHETPGTLIIQQLNEGKADFYYKKSREAIRDGNFSLAFDQFVQAIKFRNDIETEIFKRYVTVLLSRFHLNKKLSQINSKELTILKDQSKDLEKSLSDKEKKLIEQNNAIRLLLDKVKELENSNSVLAKELLELKAMLTKANNFSLEQKDKLKLQDNTIKEHEITIRNLKAEIVRQKSIKWYQKLFGAK